MTTSEVMDIFGSADARKMPPHFFTDAISIDYATAVRADISKQDYTVCPRHWYVNAVFKCVDCATEFLFSVQEQQFWYEDRRFYVDSYPKRCPDCRKKERLRKESAQKPKST